MNRATVANMIANILSQPAQTVALEGDDWTCTYGELSRQVMGCAQQLRNLAVLPGDSVAVYGDDPRLSTVGILSALLLGCPFVCLDVHFPLARKQHMLARSQARVLLYSQEDPQLAETGCKVDVMRSYEAVLPSYEVLTGSCDDEQWKVAYHVYTSGSTGQPKGIAIARHSLAVQVQAARQQYQLLPGNRALCILSSSTDAFLQQLLMFLSAGACVCFTRRTMLDPAEFAKVCISKTITHIDVPPSLLANFLADSHAADWLANMHLSTVILGGEEFSHNIVRHWDRLNLFERIALYNEYGPSEATVTSCLHRVTRADLKRSRVPIGRPSAGSILLIVDEHGRPAKQGELLIGGEGLALAYLAEPQKTAQQFISMARLGGMQRFYRSGDLVQRDEQGLITYLGRLDNQVNLLGHRIELEGIEAVLNQYPGIHSSAVLCVDTQLIAFIASDLTDADTSVLRNMLSEMLPAYMLPAQFFYYTQLPTTAIGKIDKPALERVAKLRLAQCQPVATLPELIAQSLNVPPAELNCDKGYKSQGGDSLKALMLQTRARQHGWTVSLSQLLSDVPLSQLVPPCANTTLGFEQELLNYALPNKLAMIHIQGIARWQVCTTLFTQQQLNGEKVHQAARILLLKYPALRLRFNPRQMTQQISKGALHLSAVLSVASFADFQHQVRDAFQSCLDGASLQEQLVTIASYRSRYGHIVAIGISHLLVDDISLQVLSSDLESLLNAPERFDRQRDWALLHWQQQCHNEVMAGHFDTDLSYWREALNTQGVFSQEVERKLVALNNNKPIYSQVQLASAQQLATLLPRLARQGISLQAVLLAALAHSYHQCSGDNAVTVALENNGRQPFTHSECGVTVEVGQAVGWFAHSAPLLLHACEQTDEQFELTQADLTRYPVGGHSYGWLSMFSKDQAFKTLTQTQPPRISVAYADQSALPEQQLFTQPRFGLSGQDWLTDEQVFDFEQRYHWLQIRFVHTQDTGLVVELNSDADLVSELWLDSLSGLIATSFGYISGE
ncbi:amino acid adenylation domain-containing protein [Pseudoalteromonas sp. OOF1S-7]|uniref:amino acid adenylation domain-containing protein n=1 Tax=Pseudoalteromonas sp. OOF1S-7 TaxID=2917757 RepID=UPI001EF5EC6C|nr:amino acid adenylation domain-containing protein [Pseudoalteromonas sp. OOF1S-7]MCG7536553.1 AMP-binding protein [Pseudoalteromonas sp. OOF1S-7]